MDFSKFRGSGDLSDITVTIQGKDHKLHKFPFYARSDYFCELGRAKPENDLEHIKVELKDFPGGNQTFEQVADFCYNMPLDISKENVIALRCAGEYLKMFGPGNLTDRADKYLSSTVASAIMVKATSAIVALLARCNAVGDMAQKLGLVDMLSEAFVDCWRKSSSLVNAANRGGAKSVSPLPSSGSSSAFTRVSGTIVQRAPDKLDESTIDCLTSLHPDWVAKILSKARVLGVSHESLGGLAVRYITCALEPKPDKSEIAISSAGAESKTEQEPDPPEANSNEHIGIKEPNDTVTVLAPRKVVKTYNGEIGIEYVLDKIVMALPEQAFGIPSVTMDWLTKVLRVATSHKCTCRGHLVRVAGEMLTHLGPEELCVISPTVLHDIVTDADQAEPKQEQDSISKATGLHGERACKLVDTYMEQMVTKGDLTSETFKMLASATKNYPRPSHDPLFEVLLSVMKSEKDSLTQEAKAELVKHINFDLLSETSLKQALDEDVIPVLTVAESALRLCSRLRSELQSVKYIAEMQEEDIQKYQINQASKIKSSAGIYNTGVIGGPSSPPPIAEPRNFTSFAERTRLFSTEYANGEENDEKSHLEPDILRPEDLSSTLRQAPHTHNTSDHLRAAQGVLNAARHKLALPVYTGYRPTRLSPPTVGTHLHHGRRGLEHDISLEDELEFKFDRTFRSLDPRVRHQRLGGHSGHRTYFPYSNHTHRF